MANEKIDGVLSQDTKALLRDALIRGVTNIGITGLGDTSGEIIGSKAQMIRTRLPRNDRDGLKKIVAAYREHNGRHIWICPAADTRPESDGGWTQANPAPSTRDITGSIYIAIKCKDIIVQDAVVDILAGYGAQSVALPDSVVMALAAYKTGGRAESDDSAQVQQIVKALDILAGGGVSLVQATDYIDITDPAGRLWGERSPSVSAVNLIGIADTISGMLPDDDFLTAEDVLGYLDDRGLEYTDEGVYAGYSRYKTRYGIILIDGDGAVALAPAAGSKVRTWDQLRRILDIRPDEADIKAAQEVVDKAAEEKPPKFISPSEYWKRRKKKTEKAYLKTGVRVFDEQKRGLPVGDVTIITGYSNDGKSTFLATAMANLVDDGHPVVVYSGENSMDDFYRLMYNVMAGRTNVQAIIKDGEDISNPKASYAYRYTEEAGEKITRWFASYTPERLQWVNSDDYAWDPDTMLTECQAEVERIGAHALIIDNLMKLELTFNGAEFTNKLTHFLNLLSAYAKKAQIAVVVIAHPKKDQDKKVTRNKEILSMNDIKGGAELHQQADRILIVYRQDADFESAYKAKYNTDKWKKLEKKKADGYIVLEKDRFLGHDRDNFIPYYFEKGTARILSRRDEYRTYEWESMQ